MEAPSTRKAEELLPLLDEQIAFVQQRLNLLNAMADHVAQADLDALAELLRSEQGMQRDGAALEERLERLRGALARQAGLPPDRMTLQRLARSLDRPLGMQLSDRRERLALLLEAVQQQSHRTAALVRHALELTQGMVDALTGASAGGALYGSAGQLRPGASRAILRHSV